MKASLFMVLLLSLWTAEAVADEMLAQAAPPSGERSAPEKGPTLNSIYPNKEYIDTVRGRVRNPALGYALGRQGDGFALGVRFEHPLFNAMYVRLHHHTLLGNFRGSFDPVLTFGLDVLLKTELIYGIFRLYAGGGGWVGVRPRPSCRNPVNGVDRDEATARAIGHVYARGADLGSSATRARVTALANEDIENRQEKCEEQKDAFGVTGGGYSGIELFASHKRGFFLEIGGAGGLQRSGAWYDSGLLVRTGSLFYF